jgi:hypothetical protein
MANRKQGGAADGQVRAELRVQTPRSWDAVGWRPVGAGGTRSVGSLDTKCAPMGRIAFSLGQKKADPSRTAR